MGFGGYLAVSAYLAACRRGLPIVVHEANARPGVANRLAAWMTTHAFTAMPSVRLAHANAVRIPLRPAITGLDRPALRRSPSAVRPRVPVSGCEARESITVAGAASARPRCRPRPLPPAPRRRGTFVSTTAINSRHEELVVVQESGKLVLRRAARWNNVGASR